MSAAASKVECVNCDRLATGGRDTCDVCAGELSAEAAMSERMDFKDVLNASAKRLRLGVAGPKNADQLEGIAVAVAELVEVNYKISNWLACAPICTPEDMAQSFGEMSALLDAALARFGGA